jgi:hypothetical protein
MNGTRKQIKAERNQLKWALSPKSLLPLIRGRIAPGNLYHYVFDNRVCIHGNPLHRQCTECVRTMLVVLTTK